MGGERASFSVILKYVVFFGKKILQLLVSKFETFIVQLKAGFTVLPNFKKIHRRKLESQGQENCQ